VFSYLGLSRTIQPKNWQVIKNSLQTIPNKGHLQSIFILITEVTLLLDACLSASQLHVCLSYHEFQITTFLNVLYLPFSMSAVYSLHLTAYLLCSIWLSCSNLSLFCRSWNKSGEKKLSIYNLCPTTLKWGCHSHVFHFCLPFPKQTSMSYVICHVINFLNLQSPVSGCVFIPFLKNKITSSIAKYSEEL
jgi:hypothetical protein